jgi:hypothetical protein
MQSPDRVAKTRLMGVRMWEEATPSVGRSDVWLAEIASDYPASIVQRTGWILDYVAGQVDVEVDTEPLVRLASARVTPTPLDPGHGRSGALDRRWNVIVAEYPDQESV